MLAIIMTTLLNLNQTMDPGVPVPLPEELQKYKLAGACWSFLQYDFGYIFRQELRNVGYCLHSFRFILHQPARLFIECPEPVTALQTTMEGCIAGTIGKDTNVRLDAGTIGLVYLPAGIHPVQLEAGITESFHIEMGINQLTGMLDEWSRKEEVMDRIRQARENGRLFPRIPLHYLMRETIDKIRRGTLPGAGTRLALRSHISDLINYYLSDIEEKNRLDLLPHHPDKNTLIKIWLDIKAGPSIKTFTPEKTAAEYFLPENTLACSFQNLFIIPFHEYVEQQCMNKAVHSLLHTQDDLDTIADALGYCNRSCFRHAFLRILHQQPESVRAQGTR